MRSTRLWLACVVVTVVATAASWSRPAAAQEWPTRPVKIVVGFGAGGTADVLARIVANELSLVFKQQFIVENKPGNSGAIGSAQVMRAEPDGYTLLIGGAFNLALAPALISRLPYDPAKDFVALGGLARVPYALAVRSGVPVSSLSELIAYARANPGRLTYGSSGVGSNSNLAIELLKSTAGLDILHIPYKGSAPAVTALVAGEIDIVCMDLALLAQHAKLGTLRLVAAAGVKRPSLAPDLRTAAEQGVPALALEPWYGLVAPAGISAEVRQKLASALNRAVRTAELRQRFEQQGYETIVDTPDTFSALMRSEAEKYARLIETAGIPREP